MHETEYGILQLISILICIFHVGDLFGSDASTLITTTDSRETVSNLIPLYRIIYVCPVLLK